MLFHREVQPSEIEECFAVMSSPGLHMEKFTPLSAIRATGVHPTGIAIRTGSAEGTGRGRRFREIH